VVLAFVIEYFEVGILNLFSSESRIIRNLISFSPHYPWAKKETPTGNTGEEE